MKKNNDNFSDIVWCGLSDHFAEELSIVIGNKPILREYVVIHLCDCTEEGEGSVEEEEGTCYYSHCCQLQPHRQ